MNNLTQAEKLHQLNTLVLTDRAPHENTPLPTYLFTETPDNQESVLIQAKRLLRDGKASVLLIIDNKGGSEPGYPGFEVWRKQLNRIGVEDAQIVRIPFTGPLLHTLSEALELVRFAKEKRLDKILIVAPPFHLLRCFISTVTAGHLNTNLRVYTEAGITQPWNEHAVHSQKAVQGLRKNLIVQELRSVRRFQIRNKLLRLATNGFWVLKMALQSADPKGEIRKIIKYRKHGSPIPLASTDEVLAYLEWRDGGTIARKESCEH